MISVVNKLIIKTTSIIVIEIPAIWLTLGKKPGSQ
jgi:hypothetical protein